MLTDHIHRNYLSRIAFEDQTLEPVYRKVNLVARALCPVRGVKSFTVHQVRIVSICETGAVLQARNVLALPDHFYLCLGKFEIFLTCGQTKRQDGSLFVRFSRREDRLFIRDLAEITFPMTTLQQLRGTASRAIEARIRPHGTNG
ncbi:hypothetical protein QTL95_28465 [Rhizobium sp. S152]|uniref:hypothetical protein n=1 Tax=Rhizobium sp. S152 TaxID=3055038 RepID=UPI0025A9915E|nr:hypothetical protein [Rhizobium sp. S152]MDM9629819.1 hypothetical protein [Rhizobium sp. S152]